MQADPNLDDKKFKAEKNETIKELVDRHMADEHHTTSDEELRNARIVLDEPNEVKDESLYEIDNTTLLPPMPMEVTDTKDEENEEETDDRGPTPPNPYDVLR